MNISVYITSYNQRAYLREAIESVLAQTLRPHEIIVVDDASSDGSQEMIRAYASQYPGQIRPIFHERNTGVTQTRVDALNAVSGDYVSYVDGDDRYLPTKLEKEAQALRADPSASIAYSNDFYMDAEGHPAGVWAESGSLPQGDVFAHTFARAFPRRNLFRMELVDYRAWRHIGFHDTTLGVYEDYDMRIRLTKHLRATYWDEPLREIRLHQGGLSTSTRFDQLGTLEYIYNKNRPLLGDLAPATQRWVRSRVQGWFADVATRIALAAFRSGRPALGIGYCLKAMRYGVPAHLMTRQVAALCRSMASRQIRYYARRILDMAPGHSRESEQ